MSITKENISLEMEQIKLERLKVYGKILTVLITVGLGTFAVSLINYSFQNRQLEQQKLINKANIDLQEKQAKADLKLQDEKAKAERRRAEMKYLGDYLQFALEDDIKKRMRFAEYFSILTISADLQENWKAYHATLESSIAEVRKREAALISAQEKGDTKLIAELKRELDLLKAKERAVNMSLSPEQLFRSGTANYKRGDLDKAEKKLEKACDMGYSTACNFLLENFY